ncbi:MAG: hypothetical protein BEN19_06245 [Epulopiscium sp. Nuni2H_MBin003]|nr:MAG: hypothetical protein BEN19_06245 [Epulopiscium sp. Nuni2H_MBin003]
MSLAKIEEIKGYRLQQISLELVDNIAIAYLNNPPVNAIGAVMQKEILLMCEYINETDEVWVLILTSKMKTFAAGVDIKRFKKSIDDKDVTNVQEVYYEGTLALYNVKVPVICAVFGHCLGGGMCYPAGADITIAVEDTLFGAPEINLSVVGGSGHLSRILPPQILRDMCFSGSFITAKELYKYGGVSQLVKTYEELMSTATAKAQHLCTKGPLVLRYLKACLNEQEDFQMQRKNDCELKYTRYMARHNDFREGVNAFLEKRPPNYIGE